MVSFKRPIGAIKEKISKNFLLKMDHLDGLKGCQPERHLDVLCYMAQMHLYSMFGESYLNELRDCFRALRGTLGEYYWRNATTVVMLLFLCAVVLYPISSRFAGSSIYGFFEWYLFELTRGGSFPL